MLDLSTRFLGGRKNDGCPENGEALARQDATKASGGGLARRTFLGTVALVLGGLGRRLRAQRRRFLRYHPLPRPVLVPRDALAAPGRARRFQARAVSLPTAANPDQPIRVTGLVTRISDADDAPDRFRAVCAVCPHEQCEVDFVGDPADLHPDVIAETGPVDTSVYLCPCHNSAFAAADGRRLGGPAPRGLYRFRVTDVTETSVVIGEVEEDVLLFF